MATERSEEVKITMAIAEDSLTAQALWTEEDEAEADMQEALAHEDEVGDEKRGYIYEKTDGDFAQAYKEMETYMRRLLVHQTEVERIEEHFNGLIEELEHRRDRLVREHKQAIEGCRRLLEHAHHDFRHDIDNVSGGTGKLELGFGDLRVSRGRTSQKWAGEDEAILDFVSREIDDFDLIGRFIRTTQSPDKQEMNKAIEFDGDTPCLVITEDGEERRIKLTDADGNPLKYISPASETVEVEPKSFITEE